MDAAQLALINSVLQQWYQSMADSLTANAGMSYASGARAADVSIGVREQNMVYSKAAEAYAQVYGRRLIDDGGSEVYDPDQGRYVFKPWFKNSNEETRKSVIDIIEQGIREGKPAGKRQLAGGGYPKGSIAADLEDIFNVRQSHASTVARTEKANITNFARLDQMQTRGVQRVRVWDGDGCQRCREANGQEWPIEYAIEHRLEHPSCRRRFQAILDGVTIQRG